MSKTSQGTKLYYDATGTPIKVTKGRRLSTNREHETADVTDLESTDREFLALNLRNNGEVALDLIYDAGLTTHAELETLFASGALEPFKIEKVKTGGIKTASFSAIVTNLSEETATGAEQTCTVTLKISGAVTIT
jgi:predicted secreted protein